MGNWCLAVQKNINYQMSTGIIFCFHPGVFYEFLWIFFQANSVTQNNITRSKKFIPPTWNFNKRITEQKIKQCTMCFYAKLMNSLVQELWLVKHFNSEVTILIPKTILPHLTVVNGKVCRLRICTFVQPMGIKDLFN